MKKIAKHMARLALVYLDFFEEEFLIFGTLVKEGQEAGEIKTDLSPNEITMLITRCMRGTLYDWLLFEENYDLLDESQKFIRTILGGIQK
jgi:YsiA-like protein, C-terminal region